MCESTYIELINSVKNIFPLWPYVMFIIVRIVVVYDETMFVRGYSFENFPMKSVMRENAFVQYNYHNPFPALRQAEEVLTWIKQHEQAGL